MHANQSHGELRDLLKGLARHHGDLVAGLLDHLRQVGHVLRGVHVRRHALPKMPDG